MLKEARCLLPQHSLSVLLEIPRRACRDEPSLQRQDAEWSAEKEPRRPRAAVVNPMLLAGVPKLDVRGAACVRPDVQSLQ